MKKYKVYLFLIVMIGGFISLNSMEKPSAAQISEEKPIIKIVVGDEIMLLPLSVVELSGTLLHEHQDIDPNEETDSAQLPQSYISPAIKSLGEVYIVTFFKLLQEIAQQKKAGRSDEEITQNIAQRIVYQMSTTAHLKTISYLLLENQCNLAVIANYYDASLVLNGIMQGLIQMMTTSSEQTITEKLELAKKILALIKSPDIEDKIVSLLRPKEIIRELPHVLGDAQNNIDSVAFSSDGKTIAVGGARGSVALWDSETAQLRKQLRDNAYQEKPYSAQALAFSLDGRFIAVGTNQGEVVVFNVENGALQNDKIQTVEPITFLVAKPDGKGVVSGSFDGKVREWTWTGETGTDLLCQTQAHVVDSIIYRPDGLMFVLAGRGTVEEGESNVVYIFYKSNFQGSLEGIIGRVKGLAFSKQSPSVLVAFRKNMLLIYDSVRYKTTHMTPWLPDQQFGALSADATRLACWVDDPHRKNGIVILKLDVSADKKVERLGFIAPPSSVDRNANMIFSPNLLRLAVWAPYQPLYIWELDTTKLEEVVRGYVFGLTQALLIFSYKEKMDRNEIIDWATQPEEALEELRALPEEVQILLKVPPKDF